MRLRSDISVQQVGAPHQARAETGAGTANCEIGRREGTAASAGDGQDEKAEAADVISDLRPEMESKAAACGEEEESGGEKDLNDREYFFDKPEPREASMRTDIIAENGRAARAHGSARTEKAPASQSGPTRATLRCHPKVRYTNDKRSET